MTTFSNSSIYNLLYQDKDYSGEARYLIETLRQFDVSTGFLLELGCGTGIHSQLIANEGFKVDAVDASSEMISQAKASLSNQENPTYFHGDARSFLAPRAYNATLSLFHVASYMTTDEDFSRYLNTALTPLLPGGIFLFDVWYGPCVLAEPPQSRTKTAENSQLHITRQCTPHQDLDAHTVNVHYDFSLLDKESSQPSHYSEDHLMRYWFQDEIEAALAKQNASLIHAEEWLTRKPISNKTFSVLFIAKKHD